MSYKLYILVAFFNAHHWRFLSTASVIMEKIANFKVNVGVQKRFQCQFPNCDYSSKWKNDLKKHERKHTGKRPFKVNKVKSRFESIYQKCYEFNQCPHPGCDYSATRSGHLTRHERTHTGGERSYKLNNRKMEIGIDLSKMLWILVLVAGM